jgi:hypothetical protein
MKIDKILFVVVIVLLIGFILVDRLLVNTFEPEFKKLETQRIVTSNKLASAKIVYENLNHVRDLVQKNMIFPGQKDSVSHETIFFDFLTTCVNDLKMKLITCQPGIPTISGNITTYGYDIELQGDFFSFGELCSKFENSRRIIAITTFDVSQAALNEQRPDAYANNVVANKGITVKLHVNTFRIKKG